MNVWRFVRDVFATPTTAEGADRYDRRQPWICWRMRSTDARTRITGRSVIDIECCVCGRGERLRLPIPRFGKIDGGEHPERVRFKIEHLHPDKGPPSLWAKPFRNPVVFGLAAPRRTGRLR